jgi:hypothetical protein
MTSNIIQLGNQHFTLRGRHTKTLGINVPGNVLVLYMMDDANSKQFFPVFAQLASKDRRVNYAIVDVGVHRDIVVQSRQTTTAIQNVPSLILYIDGLPHVRFNGQKSIQALENFLTKALSSVDTSDKSQQPFISQQTPVGGGLYGGPPGGQPSIPFNRGPGLTAGYNPPPTGGAAPGAKPNYYMPEIGNGPSMQGALKGAAGKYASLGSPEEEDDDHMIIPDNIIPYNRPWASEYQTMGNQ